MLAGQHWPVRSSRLIKKKELKFNLKAQYLKLWYVSDEPNIMLHVTCVEENGTKTFCLANCMLNWSTVIFISVLKMEQICSSETLAIIHKSIQHHNPNGHDPECYTRNRNYNLSTAGRNVWRPGAVSLRRSKQNAEEKRHRKQSTKNRIPAHTPWQMWRQQLSIRVNSDVSKQAPRGVNEASVAVIVHIHHRPET